MARVTVSRVIRRRSTRRAQAAVAAAEQAGTPKRGRRRAGSARRPRDQAGREPGRSAPPPLPCAPRRPAGRRSRRRCSMASTIGACRSRAIIGACHAAPFRIATRIRPSRRCQASTSMELPASWHSRRWNARSAWIRAAKSSPSSVRCSSAARSAATAASRRGDAMISPDGDALECRADLEELAHLGRGQTADPQHAAVAGGDQALLLQVPQRLPDRATADPEGTRPARPRRGGRRGGTGRRGSPPAAPPGPVPAACCGPGWPVARCSPRTSSLPTIVGNGCRRWTRTVD